MPGITIVGSGSYAPGTPYTNQMLTRVMDTNDDWIHKRTGIKQRHYAPEGTGASDLGAEAAKRACESSGIDPQEIDYIIMATMTPDYPFPGSGGIMGAKLGIPGVPALDVRQQCCAMPFSFQVANGLVTSKQVKTVLVVGAECHAGFMPWHDWSVLDTGEGQVSPAEWDRATRHRGLAVLFGDGAGALLLREADEAHRGFIGAQIHSDGNLARQIFIEGGGFRRRPYWSPLMFDREEHIPHMEGRELFKHAVTKLPKVVRDLCDREGYAIDDIDWFIAHQANDRINQAVREALKQPREKVPSNIERYGNTSAGTIPILVDELLTDERIKRGDLLCFLALGSGLHWGAALMRL